MEYWMPDSREFYTEEESEAVVVSPIKFDEDDDVPY
jgi:hypothetical protein